MMETNNQLEQIVTHIQLYFRILISLDTRIRLGFVIPGDFFH